MYTFESLWYEYVDYVGHRCIDRDNNLDGGVGGGVNVTTHNYICRLVLEVLGFPSRGIQGLCLPLSSQGFFINVLVSCNMMLNMSYINNK